MYFSALVFMKSSLYQVDYLEQSTEVNSVDELKKSHIGHLRQLIIRANSTTEVFEIVTNWCKTDDINYEYELAEIEILQIDSNKFDVTKCTSPDCNIVHKSGAVHCPDFFGVKDNRELFYMLIPLLYRKQHKAGFFANIFWVLNNLPRKWKGSKRN